MRGGIDKYAEMLREWWLTYSIYVMIPVSVIAFAVALYFMLHDVL
jgi:hypothetical protein